LVKKRRQWDRCSFCLEVLMLPIGLDLHASGRAPLIYFFLVPQSRAADATRYQHAAIALGEGLAELGIPFVSNIDHWHRAPGAAPLFRVDPTIDPASCSAVIFTSDWLEDGRALPASLFEGPTRPISVYLDHEDGSRVHSMRPGFSSFDLVLRAHFGALTTYPATFHPWAFGLSNRIIEATAPQQPAETRMRRILVSYRHGRHPHSVRTYLERRFLERLADRLEVCRYAEDGGAANDDPLAAHLWHLTGRRHSSRYYSALRESAACASFGGYFISDRPRDERHLLSRLIKRGIGRLHLHTRRITQFDSWRLWESLAAGCATVHLDLERYGVRLPVMPRNWEHYIGLNLDRLDEDIERMCADPDVLSRVGAAGRAWSIANYGPRPTAERFLALVGVCAPA
jgi:hypothetical protein